MLEPVRTVPPADMPVSLAEAKANLRVDFADDDALIEAKIATAVQFYDGWQGVLGRCLITQTWRQSYCGWPEFDRRLRLPFPDVASVTVTYVDESDVEQTVAAGDYDLLHDALGSFVRFRKSFAPPPLHDDRIDAVRVTMIVGYGAPDDVPGPIKTAILLTVGHLYENREDVVVGASVTALPGGADSLIAPHRWRRL